MCKELKKGEIREENFPFFVLLYGLYGLLTLYYLLPCI